MGELVEITRKDGIARVGMHRKGNNSIAEDLMIELVDAFDQLGSDAEVRCIVLASDYEKYFSVGADLGSMGGIDREAADAEDRITEATARLSGYFDRIESCRKPVIAAVNGHALGGGCELTLCCDYRVMVEDGRSKIGQSESPLGIIPGAGGTQRLPRLIGKARALPMLFEGTRLGAREAESVGLVSRAVAPGELEAVVAELAGRLALMPTVALGLIKDAVNRGLDLPLDEAMKIENRNFAQATLTEDAVIGIVAFLQKETPQFKGR